MEGESLLLDDYRFTLRKRITPEEDAQGRVREFMPQERYAKAQSKRLNRHGHGPFCRFSVSALPPKPGIYALNIAGEVVYIGKAANLAERWGPRGYGTISPANCFQGGQPTNCRINHAILRAVCTGQPVDVWTRADNCPAPAEARLIRRLGPSWNVLTP